MEEKKRVLIVEDEKSIVDIVRFNLEKEGYAVLTAYDGDAGLSAAREERPDLILLDVMLPKRNGFDVCLPQPPDGDVHRAHIVAYVVVVPDLLHEVGPGVHLPRVPRKEEQQLVFPLGQVHPALFLPAAHHGLPSTVLLCRW